MSKIKVTVICIFCIVSLSTSCAIVSNSKEGTTSIPSISPSPKQAIDSQKETTVSIPSTTSPKSITPSKNTDTLAENDIITRRISQQVFQLLPEPFSMDVPNGWLMDYKDASTSIVLYESKGNAKITISIVKFPQGSTLTDFVNLKKEALTDWGVYSNRKVQFESEADTIIAGRSGRVLTYSAADFVNGVPMKHCELLFMSDLAYSIKYSTGTESYNTYYPLFQQTIVSFKFIN